jgi:hypothetical protein
MIDSKIKDRLQKLLRHEESARKIGSMEEAAAFAAKAQSMLMEFGLSMSDVDIAAEQTTLGEHAIKHNLRLKWMRELMSGISYANGCVVVIVSNDGSASLVGEKTDTEVAAELFRYFAELGQHLADKEATKLRGYYNGSPGQFKKSFLHGYAYSISLRFIQRKREIMAEATQSTALIHIGNKLAKAHEFSDAQGYKTRKTTKPKVSAFAYQAGRIAGNNVALTNKAFD